MVDLGCTVPSQGVQPIPRSLSGHFYSDPQIHGFGVAARAPTAITPSYRPSQEIVTLHPAPIAMDSSNPFGLNSGLPSPTLPQVLMTEEDSYLQSPTSPTYSGTKRRQPLHPEGTPQPKGRGARKATKVRERSLRSCVSYLEELISYLSRLMTHPKLCPATVAMLCLRESMI